MEHIFIPSVSDCFHSKVNSPHSHEVRGIRECSVYCIVNFPFFFLESLHVFLARCATPTALRGARSLAIRREVKAAHVYGMALMYLYVTSRQMSRCFITLSVRYKDDNNTWIWK